MPDGYKQNHTGLWHSDTGFGPFMYSPDGTISQGLPKKFYTNGDGARARIRMDVAQTSFFAGQQFLINKRLNIAASGSMVIKFTCPVNFVVFHVGFKINSGDLDYSALVGATEGGSFSESIPIQPANTMTDTPAYTIQSTAFTGGTVTGGTEISHLPLKAAQNTVQGNTVGEEVGGERGLAPGTVYLKLTNLSATDPIVGVFTARGEERPNAY